MSVSMACSMVMRSFALTAFALHMTSSLAADVPAPWGTYLKPFSAQSPWNARPVIPVLGDFEIPRSTYFPAVAQGKYSTGVFLASESDRSMEVMPLPGKPGVWDPDAESFRPSITIARWPANVLPASGSDGHADIVDPVAGIVHSFFKLKNIDGRWCGGQYAWTHIGGRGWGDPAHYFQGARAAAVPSMGGIVRKHEVDDGDSVYRHALAMSLTHNALSANPTHVFPATSADSNAASTNTGHIPEGALIMLPPDFDSDHLHTPRLRKLAETLKRYGAYVVDRNVGTPFVIYVENGSNFKLHDGSWSNVVAGELDRIRAALRQVVSVSGWLDGNDQPMQMEQRLNLLSMRGPWRMQAPGKAPGVFDSWRQAVLFEPSDAPVVQANTSERGLSRVPWAQPVAGRRYRISANTTGGGRLRFQLLAPGRPPVFDSGELEDGGSADFEWPTVVTRSAVIASSGRRDQPSSVGGTLIELPPASEGTR